MNPFELRIGNFLTYEGQTARAKTIVYSIANVGVGLGSIVVKEQEFNFIKYKDCQPIKLTEQWLNAFQFLESNTSWQNGFLTITSIDGSYYFTSIPGTNVPITYVHQLQNLAYAIQGTDLKLDHFNHDSPK